MDKARFDIINDFATFSDYYRYNFNMQNMKAKKIYRFVFNLK